jgi:hypothetical protein
MTALFLALLLAAPTVPPSPPYPFARIDDDLPARTHRGPDGHLVYYDLQGREHRD